jgi:molybdate transport system substrate-binding protein
MSTAPASTPAPIRILSSMATKQILADLVALYHTTTGQAASVESVGGVDAARRVLAGEVFDVVILARNAMDTLHGAGKLADGSLHDLLVSGVGVAVQSGTPHPDISSEAAVKQAVLDAPTLGYSTGPSGVQLAKLFEHWGIAEQIKPRIVQAPPGVPVGALIAKGQVALGFQQLSELLNVQGLDLVGMLPPEIEIVTTFSGAVAATCSTKGSAQELLAFFASPVCAPSIRRNGMEPAL